jgi:alkylation response protein AidB-like acyl-CoA dehydrogenase
MSAAAATPHVGAEPETLALLRHSVAGLARFDGQRIRAWRDRPPGFDRALWREMADQGWFAIAVPEAEGGLALGIEAAAIVAEQLGRACLPEPYVTAGFLGPMLLAQSTNEAARRELLPGVLSGETVLAPAWQPADGGISPSTPGVVARPDADGYVLSGESRFVVPAEADIYLVLARDGDGLLLAAVDGRDARILRQEPGPDGVSSAWLAFQDLRVPKSRLLMSGDAVAGRVEAAFDQAVIVQSAELCGLMQRALEMTLDYLRTRRQFDAPIGSFQALQHRAVDLFIQQELARHATGAAVRTAASTGDGRALSRAASSAKARAAHAALLIATQSIQLHGAIGFTDEYDLGLYVNRIVRLAASFGNAAEHRRRFAAASAET